MNLGNQPVEIMIEDVYLLVVPSPQSNANSEEDENHSVKIKIEDETSDHSRSSKSSSSGTNSEEKPLSASSELLSPQPISVYESTDNKKQRKQGN